MDEENQDLDSTEQAPVEEQGTGDATENVEFTAQPATNTDAVQPADETQVEETFAQGEENLDPRKLDPALQPIFKRMQAAYTKRMQHIAGIEEKAAVVDRFYTDQAFAQQTLQQWAAQNGYQITPVGQQAQSQGQQAQGAAPAYLIEAFQKNLAPELQWMAEPLAKAQAAAMQGMLQPVFEQQQQQTKQQQVQEWQRLADELGNVAPGWEAHEQEMGELYDFLQSKSLSHPKLGSKLQMLYDLVTAKSASLKQAQQRVAAAGKNRVTSSRPVSSRPNLEQDISKASTQDAWKLAVKHALAQHQQKSA